MSNVQLDEKRMAGDYEIKTAIRIGGVEIVFGENQELDKSYFCGVYSRNEIFAQYTKCMVSDGYAEIIQLFGQRIQEQAEKVLAEQASLNVPVKTVTADDCFPHDYSQNIEGKVVAVKADSLAPEYRTSNHQLILITGGNGASGKGRGNACFSINLYTGEHCRWERYDIQGIVKPEAMPEWAKQRESEIRSVQHQPKEKSRSEDAR